jgi:hypothetical protein
MDLSSRMTYANPASGRASRCRARRPERGEGNAKAILWTFVLIVAVFLGIKLIPAFVSEYRLQDRLLTEARFATVNRRGEEELRNIIFQQIQDLEIPARREDIKIEISSRYVRISVEYTVPVDLWLYSTELHFNPSTENKSLL